MMDPAAPAAAPTSCRVDGCRTAIGLTTFSIQPETLRQLGYAAGEDPLVVRVCTFHWMLAMSTILARLGLPRAEPTAKTASNPAPPAVPPPSGAPR